MEEPTISTRASWLSTCLTALCVDYLNKDMVHQTHQHIRRLKVQKPVISLTKLNQLELIYIASGPVATIAEGM